MAIPEFVLALREKIGTDPLWLSGVTAVVLDDADARVLLIRRSDNGAWTPITGIIDPGEEPAVAAVREAEEEAGVRIRIERLVSVGVTRPVVYDNGDRAQYLDHTFLARYVGGDPRPVDGEASEVRWYPLDELPAMSAEMLGRIAAATSGDLVARFAT